MRVDDSAKDIGKRLLRDLSSPDNEDFSREFSFIIIIPREKNHGLYKLVYRKKDEYLRCYFN